MDLKQGIFREYDIRGVFPAEINRGVAYAVGRAFATVLRRTVQRPQPWVSVGMDVRRSSPDVKLGMAEGLADGGVNVLDIGMVATPVLYYSLFQPVIDNRRPDGGVMITASHNPAEFNGIKLCIGPNALYGDRIQELFRIAVSGDTGRVEPRGTLRTMDMNLPYVGFMTGQFFHLRKLFRAFARPPVAIDCGNGTAGPVVAAILEQLEIPHVPLFFEPDGAFPNHHPDPTVPKYIQTLIDTVRRRKLLAGIGYDGDTDRLGAVDSKGTPVWGDRLLLLFARGILKQNPGAKILGEVKCSQALFAGIRKFKGVPIIYRTGHSLIKEKMKKEHALLAGEMSGHMFFNDRYFGYDDAIYASLRLLEIIGTERKPLDRIISFIPKTHVTPEIRFDCPDDRKFAVVERVKKAVKADGLPFLDIDGVRVQFPDGGFGLVRASNTQPVLVMRFEAKSARLLEQHRAYVTRLVEQASRG
jgi:phosphomannomutase/phosphoglucomutase